MTQSNSWLFLGASLAGLAVAFGAFAAHGLDHYFVEKYAGETRERAGVTVPAAQKYLDDFKSGARYQMYHALGLLAVGLLSVERTRRSLQVAGWSFLLGILFFSGSLYALTITGQRGWGMVAPIGGILMMVGWAALAVAVCPCRKNSSESTSHS